MQILKGNFNCTVDEKGRIMFPSAWKKKVEAIKDEGFIIKKSLYYDCLEIYAMGEWNKMLNRIVQENQFSKKIDDLKRYFLFSHREFTLDGTGRLLIPKDLIELAKISKEVVLAAAINKIEIWDKSKYNEVQEMRPANIEDLVNEVMKEIKPN